MLAIMGIVHLRHVPRAERPGNVKREACRETSLQTALQGDDGRLAGAKLVPKSAIDCLFCRLIQFIFFGQIAFTGDVSRDRHVRVENILKHYFYLLHMGMQHTISETLFSPNFLGVLSRQKPIFTAFRQVMLCI